MLIKWLQTEDTPLRFVEAGTVAETDDDEAKKLIDAGIAVAVAKKSERAVKAAGETAVKK